MKLGDLIAALRRVNLDGRVYFDRFGLVPMPPMRSYRGYYEQLALGFSDDRAAPTVATLLADCERALGSTIEGYKGGSYRVDADTEVWASNWGNVSDEIVAAVTADGNVVTLVTEHRDW